MMITPYSDYSRFRTEHLHIMPVNGLDKLSVEPQASGWLKGKSFAIPAGSEKIGRLGMDPVYDARSGAAGTDARPAADYPPTSMHTGPMFSAISRKEKHFCRPLNKGPLFRFIPICR